MTLGSYANMPRFCLLASTDYCVVLRVISGALVVIGGDLGPTELSNQQKEFITAATSLGALLAGIVSGALADQIGRKWVVAIADLIFIVGAVIQAVSGTLWLMVAG